MKLLLVVAIIVCFIALSGQLAADALGTSSPVYVPLQPGAKTPQVGQCYFMVQIVNAAVLYSGNWLHNASQVMVTTTVKLDGGDARSINAVRPIVKNHQDCLGLGCDIVEPMPLTQSCLGVSVSFVPSVTNRLEGLQGIINSNELLTPLSIAPGKLLVAQQLSKLAGSILDVFCPKDSKGARPSLDMSWTFNPVMNSLNVPLPGDLRDGYYVFFASQDGKHPLPVGANSQTVTVNGIDVNVNGQPVRDMSYLVLLVRTKDRKTKEASSEAWSKDLSDLDTILQDVDLQKKTKNQAYDECIDKILAARTLLGVDPSYLQVEKNEIIQAAIDKVKVQLTPATATAVLTPKEIKITGLPSYEALDARVKDYSTSVKNSMSIDAEVRTQLQGVRALSPP